jgi:uncharacterized integral membrane protein
MNGRSGGRRRPSRAARFNTQSSGKPGSMGLLWTILVVLAIIALILFIVRRV